MQVLIVDDSQVDRELLRNTIAKHANEDYHFLEADNAKDALRLYQIQEPDVVLLDYNLPDMHGSVFLDELTKLTQSSFFPIIIMTTHGSDAIAVECMKKGALDYIVKSNCNPQDLCHTLVQVNQRYRLKQKIEEKNRELAQFSYVAAHDLKSPLRVISIYSQKLQEKYASQLDEKGQHYLKTLVDNTKYMSSLIQNLLFFSTVDQQKEKAVELDLTLLAREAVDKCSYEINESNAIIKVEELPRLVGLKTILMQLFQNLISNGIKYQPVGQRPEIHIYPSISNSRVVEIIVQDNGIGIDPKYAEKIFQPFQRLHATEEYAGSGIGLATCRKIVEQHEGKLWIESEIGKGSSFHIHLKVYPERLMIEGDGYDRAS